MPAMDHEKEIRDLKRRVDLAETKLSQRFGQFELISRWLRDIQHCMYMGFGVIDDRLASIEQKIDDRLTGHNQKIDNRLTSLEQKIDALPSVIARMLGKQV